MFNVEEVAAETARILDASKSDEYVAVPSICPVGAIWDGFPSWVVLSPTPRREIHRMGSDCQEAALDMCAALNFGRHERRRRSVRVESPYQPGKMK